MKDRPDGIYNDISEKEYFANTERINSSMLKKIFYKSEKHLDINNSPDGSRFGKVTHAYYLEPDKFNEECVLIDQPKTKTESSKAWQDEINRHAPKLVYTQSELDLIKRWGLPSFNKNKNELTIYATCPVTKLKMKARIDSLEELNNNMYDKSIDLKTISDGSQFQKDSYNYGYVFSQAYYAYCYFMVTGKFLECEFISLEKTAPYNVDYYPVYMEDMELWTDVVKECLKKYKKILDTGIKKGYNPNRKQLKLKGWQKSEINNFLGRNEK